MLDFSQFLIKKILYRTISVEKCSGLMIFNYSFPIKLNVPNISFGLKPVGVSTKVQPIRDGFATNPIYDNFGTKEQIEAVAKANPRINNILNENKIALKINVEELEKLKQGHMKDTRVVTAQIYSSLPAELKQEVNLADLQNAAMLHDYGKVLIPKEILNKKDKLSLAEREIMEQHSELGYELLKGKGLSENCLNLIRNHHQNCSGNGYPAVEKNYKHSIEAQILTVADKYSALREKRSYKNPLGKYEALEIIAKDVNKGLISQDVYTALIKAV